MSFIYNNNGNFPVGPAPVADMALDPNWRLPEPRPCYLLGMPHEILLRICKTLFEHDSGCRDLKSLSRLARTCKAMANIARPVLYGDIIDPSHVSLAAFYSGRLRMRSLLVTLRMSPALRPLVRSLRLLNARFLGQPSSPLKIQLHHMTIRELFGIDASRPGAMVEPLNEMALVCLAPNLTSLTISPTPDWGDTDFLLARTNGRVTGVRHAFPNLRSLTVLYRPYNPGFRRAAGVNLHKLNGLLHAATRLATLSIGSARGGTSLTARLAHLTSLTLTDSFLSARGVRLLLRGCERLEHLRLDGRAERASMPANVAPASPWQVVGAARPAAAALRRLRISGWLPAGALPNAQFPLLERLAAELPLLRHVAVDYRAIRRDGNWAGGAARAVLGELLRGCHALESVFLFGIKSLDGDEFRHFARMVVAAEWPRLRRVWLQPHHGRPQQGLNMDAVRYWWDLTTQLWALDREVRAVRAAGVQVVVLHWSMPTRPFAEM